MIRPNNPTPRDEELLKLAALLERSIHDLSNTATIFEMKNQLKISALIFDAVDLLMQARVELGESL